MESQLVCVIQRIYVGLYSTRANMSIHICGLLIKVSMLAGMGCCVRACCENTLRVCSEAGAVVGGVLVGCLRLQL